MTKYTVLNYFLYKANMSKYGDKVTYLDDEIYRTYKKLNKRKIESLINNVKRSNTYDELQEYILTNCT